MTSPTFTWYTTRGLQTKNLQLFDLEVNQKNNKMNQTPFLVMKTEESHSGICRTSHLKIVKTKTQEPLQLKGFLYFMPHLYA